MRSWLITFAVCVLATAISYFFIDVPVANFIHGLGWEQTLHSPLWSTPVLIIALDVVFIFVGIRAFGKCTFSPWEEAIVLATLSLALAICLNEFVLKPLFGRPMPHNFFATGHHTFGWMRGDRSSFPSGHTVQIAAVGLTIWKRLPHWRIPCAIVVFGLMMMLLLGNWHFVSDLIAGGFIGAFGVAMISALWESRTDSSPRITVISSRAVRESLDYDDETK